jgi:hypothetical protein
MADINLVRNVGALGDILRLSDHATATAGGTGDATSTTGIAVDREGFSTGSLPLSMLASVVYEATLGSGNVLSIGYAVQHSADNSSWSDYQTATYTTVATGLSGGSVQKGAFNVQVNLTSAKRYVRFNFMPDLNRAGTDTGYYDAVGFIAGFDRHPAPN